MVPPNHEARILHHIPLRDLLADDCAIRNHSAVHHDLQYAFGERRRATAIDGGSDVRMVCGK